MPLIKDFAANFPLKMLISSRTTRRIMAKYLTIRIIYPIGQTFSDDSGTSQFCLN